MTALPASPPRAGHDLGWVTAAPLWAGLIGGADPKPEDLAGMQRPALLRLDTDDFMVELTNRLATDPPKLADLVAVPRTYRPGPPGATSTRAIDHVKLFQPVHGHFNLVAATLVCRVPGLPDRAVDPASSDEVGFVLRRVVAGREYAWTVDGWVEVADVGTVPTAEQLFPLFPIVFPVGERRRRMFVGMIPTAAASSAKDGGSTSLGAVGPGAGAPADHRLDELDTKIITPLGQWTGQGLPIAERQADRASFLRLPGAQRKEVSRFLLLDLADLLARYVPPLWAAIAAQQAPGSGGLRAAYLLLRDTFADSVTAISWLAAIRAVWAEREAIWGETGQPAQTAVDLSRTDISSSDLRSAVVAAWPTTPPSRIPEFPAPKVDPRPSTRYVVRCVYRRPGCCPRPPALVSAPSTPFAIASFFDLDAPARPIQIALPVDTTIAGLRKAPRNVSVMISRELRQQMERVMDVKKVLKGEMDSPGGLDFGLICSFSLPIITICALIVLMIFVFLLNIVFWWVPYFRICFPLQLKASD